MNNKEKAQLLYDRHIKVIIEWGGTDFFTNCSDMSIDGVEKLLDIMENRFDDENINNEITNLIKEENEKQQD